ncbi:hypothetical protein [Kitasatospora sp. NPDC088783]|uniref:hypothetical protein n=1 Tax=Kitasatospora sp. NPDC088783 TaxID=3364077 RepID=UPI0038160F2A
MSPFSVWAGALVVLVALLLVLACAWLLFAGSAPAGGRHRSGGAPPVVRLARPTDPVTPVRPVRLPRPARPDRLVLSVRPVPVRRPNTLPLCSRHRGPVSVRTLHRTIMPRFPVFHGPAVRIAVRKAPRPVPPPRVLPLWAARTAPGPAGRAT